MKHQDMIKTALDTGFSGAEVIAVEKFVMSAEFRAACEVNRCGLYGKCWMCPPDIGEIGELMDRVCGYSYGLIYQTVTRLEDSYDIEGMQRGGGLHSRNGRKLWKKLCGQLPPDALHLSSGGCRFCKTCSKSEGEPCRAPGEAVSSLEAYGIDVIQTVGNTGLKYNNGQNTVTYFGVILF